jgi:hypothetical protein
MTDRPRDQVSLVLEIVLAFFETAERLGDVAGDRRFLGNDEGLRHGAAIELTYGGFASQGPVCEAWSVAVTLWLAQLNEIFPGQLLDQTFQFEL